MSVMFDVTATIVKISVAEENKKQISSDEICRIINFSYLQVRTFFLLV